jgi:hypothetical protein
MPEHKTLPTIDLVNWAGIYTKISPDLLQPNQLRVAENIDLFKTYGAVAKLKGNKRVLNSVVVEGGDTKGIPWVHFYKSENLNGSILREVLFAAGTKYYKVDDSVSPNYTELASGQPEDLFRTADQIDRFLLITSQDPNNVGTRGDKLKFDGVKMVTWGVTAPGSQETVIDDFQTVSDWIPTNGSVASESTVVWQDTSLKLTKTNDGVNVMSMERVLAEDFTSPDITFIEDRLAIQVFIPREEYRKLRTTDPGTGGEPDVGRGAISIYFSSTGGFDSGAADAFVRYDFRIGELVEGWNTLLIDYSILPAGLDGGSNGVINDAAVDRMKIEVYTENNADLPAIYFDEFREFDNGTPINPTPSGIVGPTFPFEDGTDKIWSWKITFIDENGNESNAGPESIAFNNEASGVDYDSVVLDIPISTDANVVARNIYRTLAGGGVWLFHSRVNDNTTTSITDTTFDTGLGTTTPPEVGGSIDNSPPPNGGIVKVWKRTAFMAGDPLNPQTLYFSRDDLPDAFPILNAFQLDSTITGIYETFLGLIVTTETAFWRVLGDNPDYVVDKVIAGFGSVGRRAVGEARMVGWAVDRDGMRLYDLRDTIKISEPIRDKFDELVESKLNLMHTIHSRKHNALLQFNQDSNGKYSSIFLYHYAKDDIKQGWYSEINIPSTTNLDFRDAAEVEDSTGDFHLYVGSNDGMLYELFADDADNWVDANNSATAITMTLRTPFIRAGVLGAESDGVTGRWGPRYVELRVKEANGLSSNWTVLIETADGSDDDQTIRDSDTLSYLFPAGVTIQRLAPKDLTYGEYCRFTITNDDVDRDLTLLGVKLYTRSRPGQFIIKGSTPGGQA